MVHQNFQEALEQLSNGQSIDEIKSKFNLKEEDLAAMNSDESLKNSVTRPTPILCSCCN